MTLHRASAIGRILDTDGVVRQILHASIEQLSCKSNSSCCSKDDNGDAELFVKGEKRRNKEKFTLFSDHTREPPEAAA